MHKLKISIRDNPYKFYLRQNNHKSFKVFAHDATIIYDLLTEKIEQHSTTHMGSKETFLSEWDCILDKLPSHLRGFVGKYVYVVAKCRTMAIEYNGHSSAVASILLKLSGTASSVSSFAISAILGAKVSVDEVLMTSYSSSLGGVALKAIAEPCEYIMTGTSYAKTAYKLPTDYNKFTSLSASGSKTNVKLTGEAMTNCDVKIMDEATYAYRVNMLRLFDIRLNELPDSLFDFCFKTSSDWNDVKNRNTSWQTLRDRYDTWESLLY